MSSALTFWNDASIQANKKLAHFVDYFQFRMTKTPFGVPLQLIDASAISAEVDVADEPDEIDNDLLTEASYSIDFTQGFPCIEGIPIWERLPNEQSDYYKYFATYLGLRESLGVRSLSALSQHIGVLPKFLTIISKMNHWPIRAKARDTYLELQREELKRRATNSMEAKHMDAATKLLTTAMDYLESHPNQLNPKVAVQMIDLAVKIGRQTSGLAIGTGRGGVVGETNINISQTANTSETNMSVQAPKDVDGFGYAESILSVLDRVGALKPTESSTIIDVEPND